MWKGTDYHEQTSNDVVTTRNFVSGGCSLYPRLKCLQDTDFEFLSNQPDNCKDGISKYNRHLQRRHFKIQQTLAETALQNTTDTCRDGTSKYNRHLQRRNFRIQQTLAETALQNTTDTFRDGTSKYNRHIYTYRLYLWNFIIIYHKPSIWRHIKSTDDRRNVLFNDTVNW
jgi:hypothetical protein